MSIRSICDAWMADLVTHVAGLADAIQHVYAPWSVENLYAERGDRHVAVWPDPSPQEIAPFIAGSPPADMVTTAFSVAIWEEATTEAARLADDVVANGGWLDLFEQTVGRIRVQANTSLGQTNSYTRVTGGSWDLTGPYRWLVVTFTVASPVSFT